MIRRARDGRGGTGAEPLGATAGRNGGGPTGRRGRGDGERPRGMCSPGDEGRRAAAPAPVCGQAGPRVAGRRGRPGARGAPLRGLGQTVRGPACGVGRRGSNRLRPVPGNRTRGDGPGPWDRPGPAPVPRSKAARRRAWGIGPEPGLAEGAAVPCAGGRTGCGPRLAPRGTAGCGRLGGAGKAPGPGAEAPAPPRTGKPGHATGAGPLRPRRGSRPLERAVRRSSGGEPSGRFAACQAAVAASARRWRRRRPRPIRPKPDTRSAQVAGSGTTPGMTRSWLLRPRASDTAKMNRAPQST